MARITSLAQLRALYRSPSELALRKQLDHLDRHCRRFIGLSPFLLLSSSGAAGSADVSPRGGPPGFVETLDDRTLAIPDWSGNNRLDTLANIVGNPGVGLLFLIPGVHETLRVNGTAEIRDDEALRARFAVAGKQPTAVVTVTVVEAFLHCSKALLRARLWDDEAKVERGVLPSLGQMLKEQIRSDDPAEPQEAMIARFRANLY